MVRFQALSLKWGVPQKMGHERIGILPKTKRWRAIVAEIAAANALPSDIPEIARHTLDALGSRYANLATDASVKKAFEFLVEMARSAAGQQDVADIGQKSALSVVADLGRHLGREGSLETAEIVKRAAADAIGTWAREAATSQEELFPETAPGDRWRGLGTGAGFCELSRLFFSRFTERYLCATVYGDNTGRAHKCARATIPRSRQGISVWYRVSEKPRRL
jgi:hypothetical protein